MFFDGIFFFFFLKKEFCKQFKHPFAYQISKTKNYRYLRKRPKLMITDQKFYLPGGLTNGQGSNYGPNRAIGTSAYVKT